MKSWSEYPLLRPALLFMVGIVIGKYVSLPLNLLIAGIISLLFAGLWLNNRTLTRKNYNVVRGVVLLSVFLLLGLAVKTSKDIKYHRYHYAHQVAEENSLILRIEEEINIKNSVKSIAQVIEINGKPSSGKLLVYFKKDSTSLTLAPGDIVKASSFINPNRPNTNPDAFQYAEYLNNRDIHYSSYFTPERYAIIDRAQLSFPFQYIYTARKWGVDRLRNILRDDNHFAIAAAMILGVRNSISDELYKAYSETGSVHVLAVSGLHVGIITILFMRLFSWFSNRSWFAKGLKLSILIMVVWSYALITGAAPAVMRAALMFTLFTIGKYAAESYNIYNILAASAVILLAYDPNLLFQASFQFSFLALLSIVYFYEEINPHVVTPYPILNRFISLGVVAIAAQVLVFPVTIYYFHKFPVYFILSGVLAVFLASFILYAGLLAIFLYGIPVLGWLSQMALYYLLTFFINGIFWIHTLPFSSVNGIWFSGWQTILIYMGLLALMYWVKDRTKVSYIYCIVAALIGYFALDIKDTMHNRTSTSMVLYDLNRDDTLLDIFTPNSLYSFNNGVAESSVEFVAANHRLKKDKHSVLPMPVIDGVFTLGDKIIFMPSMHTGESIPQKSDYLLLIDNYNQEPEKLLMQHKTSYVILDKSIPGWLSKKWKAYCQEHNIDYYSVYEQGAFIETF